MKAMMGRLNEGILGEEKQGVRDEEVSRNEEWENEGIESRRSKRRGIMVNKEIRNRGNEQSESRGIERKRGELK